MFGSKVINEDSFIAALYGQKVLDATPLNLRQHLTTNLLRVQHAIEVSCTKHCFKELVAALEWSENKTVLTEILQWAKEAAKSEEIKKSMSSLSKIDLAPQRVPRPLSSLFSSAQPLRVQPRVREIHWKENMKDASIKVLETCGNKIIMGLFDGQIVIYNSLDLKCEKTLPHYRQKQDVSVECLQCTCTEIIAGYMDGSICAWNIQSGALVAKLQLQIIRYIKSNVDATCIQRSATSMRWKEPKLVVGTNDSALLIFQFINSDFKALGKWRVEPRNVKRVDFDAYYVVVFGSTEFDSLEVRLYNWSGKLMHTVSRYSIRAESWCQINDATYADTCIIIVGGGGMQNFVQILDVKTGKVLQELQEPNSSMVWWVDTLNNCILAGGYEGSISIWSIENPAKVSRLLLKNAWNSEYQSHLRLGRNFFVGYSPSSSKVIVTDFL